MKFHYFIVIVAAVVIVSKFIFDTLQVYIRCKHGKDNEGDQED